MGLRRWLLSSMLVTLVAGSASAQSESRLKQFFEGRRVVVKIDMPATHQGVNLRPERYRTIDIGDYNDKLSGFGVALAEGQVAVVTKVKVKGKHVEFQLNGGGYGTFFDPVATTHYVDLPKSRRERHLEEELACNMSDRRRKKLERELYRLRDERAREQAYLDRLAEEARDIEAARIREEALHRGSRFNIRYDRKLHPPDLTPEALLTALAEVIELR